MFNKAWIRSNPTLVNISRTNSISQYQDLALHHLQNLSLTRVGSWSLVTKQKTAVTWESSCQVNDPRCTAQESTLWEGNHQFGGVHNLCKFPWPYIPVWATPEMSIRFPIQGMLQRWQLVHLHPSQGNSHARDWPKCNYARLASKQCWSHLKPLRKTFSWHSDLQLFFLTLLIHHHTHTSWVTSHSATGHHRSSLVITGDIHTQCR